MSLKDDLFCYIKRDNALAYIPGLIERGAKPGAVDEKGRTLLHYAAEKGDIKLINYLTRKLRINPNIQDHSGQTAMHMAATQFYGNVITALHKVGGDVNATDKMGLRPLHIAAVYGHIPVACKLIKRGADITAKSYAVKRGCCSLTAKEAAIIANQTEMVGMLEGIEAKQQRKQMMAEQAQAPAPVFICSHDDVNISVKTKENQKS